MPATHVVGLRKYSTQSGRIVTNVLPKIILINENINDAAFLAFFSECKKVTTPQEKITWDVDEYLAIKDLVNGAVSGTPPRPSP